MTRRSIAILGAGNVGNKLTALIGFDAADCGNLEVARYLERFAMTAIHRAIELGHGRSFAFARLRRTN